jgi:hypothetical protein
MGGGKSSDMWDLKYNLSTVYVMTLTAVVMVELLKKQILSRTVFCFCVWGGFGWHLHKDAHF